MPRVGKVVEVVWSDAFDESETHPSDLKDEYIWHTYGRVLRDNKDVITVATSIGGSGADERVYATTILKSMVRKVKVIQ